ncbi:MAG: acyl-CoA synthetase [Pseudohongiellaceae bacterium]
MSKKNIYEQALDKNRANYTPLTPLNYIERAAAVYPDRLAVIHQDTQYTWAEIFQRSCRLASALTKMGIGKGDTVSFMGANTPETFEAHFGVPMAGAVLNALNVRLDAKAIAFILQHAEAKVLFTDKEYSATIKTALELLPHKIPVIDIDDPYFSEGERLGQQTYEEFISSGDLHPAFTGKPEPQPRTGETGGASEGHHLFPIDDEWQAISLNYTSGTTGDPKGVVFHHRGACLSAVSNAICWNLPAHPTFLWTLPMFHCNGWCFPWTLAAYAGTSVCLRHVRDKAIFDAIRKHKVSHFCGAPVVLNTLINAAPELKKGIEPGIEVMTAGAAPPPSVIAGMEDMGFKVTHAYGLTETYGPCVTGAPQDEWAELDIAARAELQARQGVRGPLQDELMVADPETLQPVPKDGEAMGEVFMRGNLVMKGYLKNPKTTEASFAGGWFHTGDLAVCHPNGYIQVKDRSKDIIISGGENISSLEVESALFRHPKILEAAVVASSDEKWGEVPCAFVTLQPNEQMTAKEVVTYCRQEMAAFKIPKKVCFGPIEKTSTGKVQKYLLRERAETIEKVA